MKVHEILRTKGSGVITTRAETALVELAQLLAKHKIGAVVVVDAEGDIAGVVSERDVVHALATRGPNVTAATVGEVMTKSVVVCAPDDTIHSVMSSMTERRFRHIPVVKDGKLAGIISIGDVVKHRLGEVEEEANVLREYVTAR